MEENGKKVALFLLGSLSPLLGIGVFLLQLQCNPHGWVRYGVAQTLLLLVFLAYFFAVGWLFAKQGCGKWQAWCFFAVPLLLLIVNHSVLRNIPLLVVTEALLLGVEAPFHHLLSGLHFAFDAWQIIPACFPTAVCFVAFCMGQWCASRPFDLRQRRRVYFLVGLPLALCGIALLVPASTQDVEQDAVFSAYEIQAGLVRGMSASQVAQVPSTEEEIVCVMRIYSDPGCADLAARVFDFGHTFLTVLNVSPTDIQVGRLMVEPGKMVSIGRMGNIGAPADFYKGVFYNMEVQRRQQLGWYTVDKSIYQELNAQQLQRVSQYITGHESGYLFVSNNCATLAVGAWNTALTARDAKHMDHFSTPALVYQEMERIGNAYDGNALIYANDEPCYYDGSALVPCKDRYLP